MAWFNNSDGGYTVDFRQPLPCNDDPLPFPHASCRKEKTETVLEVEVVQAHVNTILEAVEVRRCLENGDLKGLFSYYTNKEPALMIAEEIPKIYSEIPYHDYCQSQTASLQKLADGIRKQLPADRAIFHCPFSNIDIMIPMLTEGARLAKCPVCGIAHEVPHNDEGKKRIWHRNRNMFMPVS